MKEAEDNASSAQADAATADELRRGPDAQAQIYEALLVALCPLAGLTAAEMAFSGDGSRCEHVWSPCAVP